MPPCHTYCHFPSDLLPPVISAALPTLLLPILLYLLPDCCAHLAGDILTNDTDYRCLHPICKTKYKMSPSSVRSEGGEAAAGYFLNSVSYRVDEAVKYNVLNSD